MASSAKASKQKNGNAAEVNSARSRLDGVLQVLVDKKEESPHTEEDSPTHDPEENLREAVGSLTPRKHSGRHSRKRRKGRDEPVVPETSHYHHTYVMKLFDRSVDLAQFDEDTPLYPICRAWMRNQPQNRNLAPRDRSPSPDHLSMDDEDSQEDCVYRLPPPEPLIKVEPGHTIIDLRIPSTLYPEEDAPLDISADQTNPPSMDHLKLNHLIRWKKIRQKWKAAAHLNESRFAESTKILHDMFETQCKDQ